MWAGYLIGAVVLLAAGGVPGLFLRRRSPVGQILATWMTVLGAALGLTAALECLLAGARASLELPGPLSNLTLHFRLDPLSAFFLAPICLIGALGAVYGTSYWKQQEHPRTAAGLRLWYGLLIASLSLVVLAADGVAFLFAWEVMAISAFFLVSTEDHKKDVREAGWLFLVASHVATLSLFALFSLLRVAGGSFEFRMLQAQHAGLAVRTAIFLLALLGFGLKAGMMPLHFWLPGAHANAPSHVSAILSGVLLKVGIYGLLRTLTLLPAPPISWGGAVLILGTASAVLGVLFAIGQHDLKRLLAYHSIENIGIILMGLGVALIGQARGRTEWIVLGLAGCLLHVWNHALFKSLLFLAAGSVIHSTRTRQIDRMGGLAKSMPATAALFLVGAVAICGLPPLNGFVSELLVYLGLFNTLDGASAAALAAPALALVGGLALACFVKAFGAVFLGSPRTDATRRTHEAPPAMIVPMIVLAACCAAIGFFPVLIVRPVQAVIRQWSPAMRNAPALGTLVPLPALTSATLALVGVLVLLLLLGRWRAGARSRRGSLTWDCAYARPTARMQYTASSFADALVGLFRGVLRPRAHEPRIVATFPQPTTFESHVDDVVLDGVLIPAWRRFRARLGRLRVLQQGSVQTYILYILAAVALLLILAMPFREALRAMLGGDAP